MKEQLPWWIGGPVLGLCVVAIRGLLNARLGVTGAFSEVIDRVGKRSLTLRLARLVPRRARSSAGWCSRSCAAGRASRATAG